MTDKTKPWLTSDHPEAIAIKPFVKKLAAELKAKGVETTGVGISLSKDGQAAAIRVNLRYARDKVHVPDTYEGVEVDVSVTGRIVPL